MLSKHIYPTNPFRFRYNSVGKGGNILCLFWGMKKGTTATEKVEDGLSLGHMIFKLLLYKWG